MDRLNENNTDRTPQNIGIVNTTDTDVFIQMGHLFLDDRMYVRGLDDKISDHNCHFCNISGSSDKWTKTFSLLKHSRFLDGSWKFVWNILVHAKR